MMSTEPEERRVLVCGGRDYGALPGEKEFLFEYLDGLLPRPTVIIEGEAPGADSLAREWAELRGIPVEKYPADWKKHGRAAGPLRNTLMLRNGRPHLVVAFPGGAGTADLLRQAKLYSRVVVERPRPPASVAPKLRTAVKNGMPMPFALPRSRGTGGKRGSGG
jgi:hypothetical protein